jgi:hypothetical protein
MTDHIDRAKRHWKKRCLIVSAWWQKTHFLLSCQFHFARLSLARITHLRRYHPNTFICNGIFNFKSLLLLILSLGKCGWISALYMDATKNLPFSCRFEQNSSCLVCRWIFAKHRSKTFQSTSLWLDVSIRNATFGGEVSNTLAMVSPLWHTILYNVGYYSRREVAPSHLSSQNLISEPSLKEKVPRPMKNFFVAIMPAQKCESPYFQRTCDNTFVPIYFLLRIVCQVACSVSNLNNHFLYSWPTDHEYQALLGPKDSKQHST